MGTLADLVEGFKGGYGAVQDSRRKRRINRAIDYELGGLEEKRQARGQARKRLGQPTHEGADFTMPETYGERLANKVKSFFSGKPAPTGAAAIDPSQASAAPTQPGLASDYSVEATGGVQPAGLQPQVYKDGGAVRRMKRYASGGKVTVANPRIGYVDGGAVIPSNQSQQGRAIGYANGGMAIPTGPNQFSAQPQMGMDVPNAGRAVVTPLGFADGGRVDEDEDPSLAGFLQDEPLRDIGRNVGGNTRRRFAEWAPAGRAADQAVLDAEGAANRGSAIRGNIAEGARGLGQIGAGLLEDTGVAPVVKGIGGFLGYGTDRADDSPEPDRAAAISAAVADDVGPPAPAAAQPVAADPPNTQTPQAQAQAQPAGPDDEIVDFNDPSYRDISPEDLPNQSVKNWEDERMFWAANAISMGNDPMDAMKAVDGRQIRGFTAYLQQATNLLMNGDATSAAKALYAGYQYFPNGADVRFGVQKGVDGKPVLVGMGTDEETGEPIKDGKPMIITAESLAVQLENMSSPDAFRTWTKDWHQAEKEIREYEEVTKPEAQSNITYRDRAGTAAIMNAEANLIDASTSGARGGLKQSDIDRNILAFEKDRELQALLGGEDEVVARDLTEAMATLFIARPGNRSSVIKFIMDSYSEGGMDQVNEDLSQLGAR